GGAARRSCARRRMNAAWNTTRSDLLRREEGRKPRGIQGPAQGSRRPATPATRRRPASVPGGDVGDGIRADGGESGQAGAGGAPPGRPREDRKSTRLNSSHVKISYAVFCLKK